MRVHIVSYDLHRDRVLARFAQILVQQLKWTISRYPDPNADLNYFLPYLTYQPCTTKTAAWFTHRDTLNPKKAQKWDYVAQHVDICTTSARQYLSVLPDGSRLMLPPLERDRFTIPNRHLEKKVIGVSGYVYHDGRKGEDLIGQLVKTRLPVEWRASGRGWPVPTRHYPWRSLPSFFQALDLFICASRVEGIPMPPLESLSCGVPIVIPRGVGLLDDIPEIPGIYRFDSGSYSSLYSAVTRALGEKHPIDREALRALTGIYHEGAWIESHQQLSDPKPIVVKRESLPEWKGRCGMYCVAFGKPARQCADRLIKSFKKYLPDIPVAFVGTTPMNTGEDFFIQQPDADVGGRIAKLKVNELAPKEWQYILYLDADTEIVSSDVTFLFQVLQDGWEYVICRDYMPSIQKQRRSDNAAEMKLTFEVLGDDHLMSWNGGVFSFRRNKRTAQFFTNWIQEWNRWGRRDQAALLRAMWSIPLKIFMLGHEFNTVPHYFDPNKTAGILHHATKARRWGKKGKIIPFRLDDPRAREYINDGE